MAIKTIFLDRDGVINKEVKYLYQVSKFEFIDGIFDACLYFQKLGYEIVIVTNQSGIARGYYNENDYLKLTEPVIKDITKVVYGSRWLNKSIGWNLHYLINQMITLLANVFNGVFLTDMPTCYKLIPTTLLQKLDLRANGFGIDAEITAKLSKNGTKI